MLFRLGYLKTWPRPIPNYSLHISDLMVSHQELAFLTSLACGETNHFQIQISLDGEIFKLQQFVFVMIAHTKYHRKTKTSAKQLNTINLSISQSPWNPLNVATTQSASNLAGRCAIGKFSQHCNTGSHSWFIRSFEFSSKITINFSPYKLTLSRKGLTGGIRWNWKLPKWLLD